MDKIKHLCWTCALVPEELIFAAGVQSKRLYYKSEPKAEPSEYTLPVNFCSLVRTYFEALTIYRDSNMEGAILTTACSATYFLYDALKHCGNMNFIYMLDVPRKQDPAGIDFFARQLADLAKTLGKHFHVTIDRDKLFQAIEHFNRIRDFLAIFHEARVSHRLSGQDYFKIVHLISISDKVIVLKQLEKIKKDILHADFADEKTKKKILLLGSPLLSIDLVAFLESFQVTVDIDDLCTGAGYLGSHVETEGDLYFNLAAAYLKSRLCSRMERNDTRIRQVKEMLANFQPDGVIYNLSKFRVTDSYESVMLKEEFFNEIATPYLVLANDHPFEMNLSMKSRLETFIQVL